MNEETLAQFREWLAGHVWNEDDMGGFATGQTEAEILANVAELFDLIDPDWREFTWHALNDSGDANSQHPS